MPHSSAFRRAVASAVFCLVAAGGASAAAQTAEAPPNDLGAARGVDAPIESYTAYIGQSDLRNSRGRRLQDVAAILRQDRANFHRFGVAHKGDQSDTRFVELRARRVMERLLERGGVAPEVAERILAGDVLVRVDVYADAEGALSAVSVRLAEVNDRGAAQ